MIFPSEAFLGGWDGVAGGEGSGGVGRRDGIGGGARIDYIALYYFEEMDINLSNKKATPIFDFLMVFDDFCHSAFVYLQYSKSLTP